jgi:D-2-hydroxyacid dehydrogenase (NADP+)
MTKSTNKPKPTAVVMLTLSDEVHHRVLATIQGRPKVSARANIIVSRSRSELADAIPRAEIFFGWRFSENYYQQAKNLRWVHLASAGIDGGLPPAIFDDDIIITCSKGLHPAAMADTAMGMMLALTRNLHFARELQKERRWAFDIVSSGVGILEGKTLGIIGAGFVGQAIAKRAKAFGMKVIGINSDGHKAAGFAEIGSISRLPWLLKQSDIVVMTIPSTDKTQNLLGPRQFALMKKGAILINIGRGRVIDQNALLNAINEGKIAGAGLDVFAEEPLPEKSPLWEIPNVIITPHIAGMMPEHIERVTNLFLDNLEKYLAGKKLSGLVSKKKGY